MTDRQTFLMAGGGTGGHLFPGIAVAEELLRRDPTTRVIFAGSERSIEGDIVAKHGYEHVSLPSMPSSSWKKSPFRFVWNNWAAYRGARDLLMRERPQAVIGLGGFASVPVVMAAYRRQVPVILLEQNAVPGRATHVLSRAARAICVSFDGSVAPASGTAQVVLTGNPVRREISELMNAPPSNSSTLLVLGGSQGSQGVNSAVLEALKSLGCDMQGWSVIHQSGAGDVARVKDAYAALDVDARVEPFLDDMVACYRDAAIVVARAGATTLAELACAGLPAILVPYPNAIGDHQMANSRALESAGAAHIVRQHEDLVQTGRELATALRMLIAEPGIRQKMATAMRTLARPQAAGAVADVILQHVPQETPA